MFSVIPEFSEADLAALIQADTDDWLNGLMEVYRTKGKIAVERARAKTKADGGFGNITWNLRGSIGYLLVKQGKVLESYFPPIGKASEGLRIGDEFAREIAQLTDEGDDIALIIVAGMEYASIVQTVTRDVIEGSTLIFEEEVKALFK